MTHAPADPAPAHAPQRARTRLTSLALLGVSLGLSSAPASAQITGEQIISGDNGGWSLGWTQANNGRLYHLGDLYGLYRSDDRGLSWTQPLRGFQSDEELIGFGVAVVPSNPNKVYYYGGRRIMRSLDGGNTWPIYTTISREGMGRIGTDQGRYRGADTIALKPGTEDEIWVLARLTNTSTGTLLRSINGGQDFTEVAPSTFAFGSREAMHLAFRPNNGNHLWVATQSGAYVSVDGGTNWGLVPGTSGRAIKTIGLSRVAGNNIALVAWYKTVVAINATNWNDVSTYYIQNYIYNNADGKDSTGDIIGLSNGDFLLSDNTRNLTRISPNGLTWNVFGSTRNTPAAGQFPAWMDLAREQAKGDNWAREDLFADISQTNTIYSDGGAGPSISTDLGATWSFICKGVRGVVTGKPVVVEGTSRAFFPCNDKGVLVHNDSGNSDTLVGVAKKTIDYEKLYVMHNVMPVGNGMTAYAVGGRQGKDQVIPVMIKTTDGGVTWSQLAASGLPNSSAMGYGNLIGGGVVDKDNPNDILVIMGDTFGTVHRSTDGGATFGPALGGIVAEMTAQQNFKSSFIERDGVNPNRRYLMVRKATGATDPFYTSDNKGANWTLRSRPSGWMEAFCVDPKVEGRLWTGSNYNLHRSDNGGISWSQIDNFQGVTSIDAINGRVLVFARRNNASTWDLWYSPDNGTTWQQLTNSTWRFPSTRNPDGVPRWKFALDPNNANRFWCSGLSGAVYTFTASGTSTAPTVTNPSPISVPAGSSANFTVSTGGSPSPTLQWQRAPSGSSTFSNLSVGGAYSGVTSPTLTVSNTTLAMSGDQFRAVASSSGFPSATSAAATLTVTQAVPVITSQLTATATRTVAFSYTITASNSPTSFSASGLPSGLSVNTSTGVISGTPTVAGTSNVTIGASNAGGAGPTSTLVLTVNNPAVPSVTSALTASATVGTAFSYTITASNSPTSYSASGLPAGLSVNTSTGVISGTPTTAGTSNVTIGASNAGGAGPTSTLVLTVNAATGGTNTGTGLRGRYFTNMNLTGSPALTRVDSTVNFSWSGSPGSGIGSDNFSVRWDGRVEAPVTGTYTFSTETDDGVRLWVNGVLVVDRWVNQGATVVTGSPTLNLTAGTLYRVVLEYYENGGGAVARLRWAYPGQATQIIPQGRLYPANSTFVSLSNSSFESNTGQTPTGWTTWANTTANEACDFVETANPRIGTNNLRHASTTGAYQVYTYRTVTGLTNGTYLVRAWTRSSGGQNAAGFEVKDFGAAAQYFDVRAALSYYTERTLSIPVTNGQMTIGFWSDASSSSQWLNVDEVMIERLP